MILIGYSKYKSKDGTKKGTWIDVGIEYMHYESGFGLKVIRHWAEYSIDIDNSLIGKPVEFTYKSNSLGKPSISTVKKA